MTLAAVLRPCRNNLIKAVVLLGLVTQGLWAAPAITSISRNSDQVGKYAKLELTVNYTGSFTNAYNSDDVDLWAEFTSPSRTPWKINGFYDGAQWKIRFAADEIGAWSYIVKAKDNSGAGQAAPGGFTCVASTNHGWIRIAPNHRYLSYDDGTSFYGVGACYPWADTTNGFDRMQALGFNIYVYWNGTSKGQRGQTILSPKSPGWGSLRGIDIFKKSLPARIVQDTRLFESSQARISALPNFSVSAFYSAVPSL